MCVCVYKSLCTREAAPVLRARTPTPRTPLPRRSPAGLLGQSPPPSTLRVTPQALLPQSWAASPFRLWEWPRGHLCACPLAHKQLSLSQPPQLSSPAPPGLPWGARSLPETRGLHDDFGCGPARGKKTPFPSKRSPGSNPGPRASGAALSREACSEAGPRPGRRAGRACGHNAAAARPAVSFPRPPARRRRRGAGSVRTGNLFREESGS